MDWEGHGVRMKVSLGKLGLCGAAYPATDPAVGPLFAITEDGTGR